MAADIRVKINVSEVAASLGDAVKIDDAVKIYAQQRLAAYMNDYVPMETGALAQTVQITPDGVDYLQNYAHYQYMGIVYGKNIYIRNEDGTIIGITSSPDAPKVPTGRHLTYSHEVHPNATDHWDEAAMAEHRQDLIDDIAAYIARRANT